MSLGINYYLRHSLFKTKTINRLVTELVEVSFIPDELGIPPVIPVLEQLVLSERCNIIYRYGAEIITPTIKDIVNYFGAFFVRQFVYHH